MSFVALSVGRRLWRESINGASSLTLCGANNECAAGGLDHVLCDDSQLINKQDPLNLHKQPVEQPEIAIGDAADSGNGLRVRKISAVKGQAQLAPMARQYKGELIALQRTVVMREADPAVELRITRQAFVDARHANEHQADRRAIKHVTQMFEGGRRETFGFVNNDQLDHPVPSDTAFIGIVDSAMLVDAALHTRRHQMQVFTELT